MFGLRNVPMLQLRFSTQLVIYRSCSLWCVVTAAQNIASLSEGLALVWIFTASVVVMRAHYSN